jgi:hypothetical protein
MEKEKSKRMIHRIIIYAISERKKKNKHVLPVDKEGEE